MPRGFSIRLGTQDFGRDPEDYAEFVRNGLRNLTMANDWTYRHDLTLPSIYEAGVVYRREPPGYEQFCDVRTVLDRGFGDCEDLACALASFYRARHGENARPDITWKPLNARHWLYHITVLRGDGSREDPSQKLGMGNEPGAYQRRGNLWVYELFPGRSGRVPDSVPVL